MNIRYLVGPNKGKTADVLREIAKQFIRDGIAESIDTRPDFQGIVDATKKPEPEPQHTVVPIIIEQPKKTIRKRPKQV
jgi:alpha-glucuronidase